MTSVGKVCTGPHCFNGPTTTTGMFPQQAQHILKRPLLLVSDLDDTLLPPPDSPQEDLTRAFKEFWTTNRAADNCRLVINSGRTLPLWEAVYAERKCLLPKPDVLILGVGTRIYMPAPGDEWKGWQEHEPWTHLIDEEWDHDAVEQALEDVKENLGDGKMQGASHPDENMQHKLTVRVHADAAHTALMQIEERLVQAGIKYKTITGPTSDVSWHYVDIIPKRAGKGAAAEYLRNLLKACPESMVVAGDAPNDLDVLEVASQAIVVANCHTQVRKWAQKKQAAHQAGNGTGQSVFLASQSTAGGVLEGLQAFGFL